mmetsp:Transcript_5081/g.10674  ORF Transcript_5081/g.10674 Transcript_5081/m.10674 type:complete len:104 (+) Transcript_5081:672-983(+)
MSQTLTHQTSGLCTRAGDFMRAKKWQISKSRHESVGRVVGIQSLIFVRVRWHKYSNLVQEAEYLMQLPVEQQNYLNGSCLSSRRNKSQSRQLIWVGRGICCQQ